MRILSRVVIAACTVMVVGCGSSDDGSGLITISGDISGEGGTPADETAPVSDRDAEAFGGAIVGRWQFCLLDPVGMELSDGGAAFSFEFEFAADGRYVRYSSRHAFPECDGPTIGEGFDIELEATYTVGDTLTTSEGLSAREVVFTAEGVSEVSFITIDGDTLTESEETEDGLITELGEPFTRQNGFLVLQ